MPYCVEIYSFCAQPCRLWLQHYDEERRPLVPYEPRRPSEAGFIKALLRPSSMRCWRLDEASSSNSAALLSWVNSGSPTGSLSLYALYVAA